MKNCGQIFPQPKILLGSSSSASDRCAIERVLYSIFFETGNKKNRIQNSLVIALCALLLLPGQPSVAQVIESAPPPFPISRKWSRVFQKYTGINLITEAAAARIAAMCIKAKLGGHVKVSLRVYSFTDLLSGKVKSVAVKLSGSSYRGVPLGNVTLASTNPIWYHPFKARKLQAGLQAPLLVNLDGSIDGICVSKLLSDNTALISKVSKIELPGLGTQQLVLLKPSTAIKDGKVCINSTVITAGGSPDTGVNLTITGVPYLDGSKIMLKDLCMSSPDIVDPGTFSPFVESVSNPLFNLARLDRHNHALRLDSLAVEGDCVKYGGKLLVAPTALAAK